MLVEAKREAPPRHALDKMRLALVAEGHHEVVIIKTVDLSGRKLFINIFDFAPLVAPSGGLARHT